MPAFCFCCWFLHLLLAFRAFFVFLGCIADVVALYSALLFCLVALLSFWCFMRVCLHVCPCLKRRRSPSFFPPFFCYLTQFFLAYSAVAALQFDPVFGMGSRTSYSSWPGTTHSKFRREQEKGDDEAGEKRKPKRKEKKEKMTLGVLCFSSPRENKNDRTTRRLTLCGCSY